MYFRSIFALENTDNIPYFPDHTFMQNLSDISITPEDVFNKLISFKPSKSAGPDNLNPRVLKEAIFQLSNPHSLIFTKTLDEGRMPPEWKMASVIPIFKKRKQSIPIQLSSGQLNINSI